MGNRLVLRAGFDGRDPDGLPEGLQKESMVDLEICSTSAALSDQVLASVQLIVRTPSDLRRVVVLDGILPLAHQIELIICEFPTWRTVPLPSPGAEEFWTTCREIASKVDETGLWEVRGVFEDACPSGSFFHSVSRMLDGHRVLGVGQLAGPCGPGAKAGLLEYDESKPDRIVDRAEIFEIDKMRGIGAPHGNAPHARASEINKRIAPIDVRSVNPIGFLRSVPDSTGTLAFEDGRMLVRREGGDPVVIPRSGRATEVEIERLRTLVAVHVPPPAEASESDPVSHVVASLAAAGVPVLAEPWGGWSESLDPDLDKMITTVTAGDLGNPLSREQYSIRLRRHALRTYGMRAQWSRVAGNRAKQLATMGPQVSVILCTKRAAMVRFGLRQIERQRGVDPEVVLALHGISADDPQVARAVAESELSVQTVEIADHRTYGEALTLASRHASGNFLAKMDDDDWYGPDHLSDFLLAHEYSGAELVSCGGEFVYLEELDATIRRTRAPSELPSAVMKRGIIAGGAFLITRDAFAACGGLPPVPIFEDWELFNSVRNAGGRVYRQHGLNFVIRRGGQTHEHLWKTPVDRFLQGDPERWEGRFFNELMELSSDTEPFN